MYATANIYIMGNTYSLQLRNIPAGCSSSPQSITIVNADAPGNFPLQNCALPTPTPTPTPVPLYSISGKMFIDANRDEKSSNGDPKYIEAVTITRSPALGSYNSPVGTGLYSFINLPSGQYTITFSGLRGGFEFTYPPLSGLPPSNSFIINIPCSNPPGEATCTLGNVLNLNSGVTSIANAWFQTTGADLRWDRGFNNPLPSSNTYTSVPGTGGMPGILFTGESTPPNQVSKDFNWRVGGPGEKREVFTDSHNLIPTSYRFLFETAESSGINPVTITTLDSSLTHGIYKTNGSLAINAPVTFRTDCGLPSCNYIILINGDLNINAKILVPVGSTAIFSAKGNITVDRSLGELSSSTTPTIEGLYSADGNFIADGLKDCSVGPDLRLNIAGSVIANAGRPQTNGTFVNNRTLCRGNTSNPSVNFIERPDFMLNYPSFVTQTTRSWQDEKP